MSTAEHDRTYELLQEVRQDVKDIRRVLYGNGAVGLTARVHRLERWRKAEDKDDKNVRQRLWDVAMMVLSAIIGGVMAGFGMGAL